MKTIGYSLIRRLSSTLIPTALFVALITPVTPSLLHAADASSGKSAPASLRPGDLYGGGKVVYLLKPGESGYVAGQTHGLVASVADIGNGSSWATAVKLCKEYREGGFSDWRLPDKAELNRLYQNKALIGGFRGVHYYWSATESDKNDAWDQSFRTGVSNLGYKFDSNYVRAVRSF